MPVLRRLAAAALAMSVALPAAAQGLEDMTDAEREAFRAEVRAYLLENPEVLMEAIGVLEQREQAAQASADAEALAALAPMLEDESTSWIGGNPDGDVTLIEFMDYRCGYCRRAFDEVEALVNADGNIRFVLKEFPILGEQSLISSQFALAVQQLHGDDAYKIAHDALITLEGDATPDTLTRLAEGLGFEAEPILARMESEEVMSVIESNHAIASQLGINGTPTFVLGGEMLRGYVPLDAMQQLVAEARAEG
ncbi:DsbA family protein [Wenxinia marina]|uniref:Protein-disulfide isomerase n=1 Tax=Wenxinia marina DSM 24838 TaxID=1123501 RepID=A0A0D0NNY5_9RHOB|nr:DsbA family protein [Wenxinia marina]KIQ70000.1 Protein-disulfide isomerase [Wenxinia marina DSM 24838]GGL62761.1 DSBA oxidoreductase [Wenxinia marina]